MTDKQLQERLGFCIREERRHTAEIVQLIAEAQDRRLYAKRGYSSLFKWLVEEFKYSEGAAGRRIAAARALRGNSEAIEKVATGELNLSNLSRAQSVMAAQEKASGVRLSAEERARVVEAVECKSGVEAERTLLDMMPEAQEHLKRDTCTTVDPETTRVAMNLSNETMEHLEKIRDLLSHSHPNASLGEIVAHLAKTFVEKHSAPAKRSVTNKRKIILEKAERKCTYQDPETGKVCGSTYQAEVDHIHPKALGGPDELDNLRCLCKQHNLLEAEQKFGRHTVRRYAAQPDQRPA